MSVARQAGRPYPIRMVSSAMGRMLVAKCADLLDGVGDHAAGFWHTDSVSVHWRCPMTDDEQMKLPDGWLACPAVDVGGREDEMTREPPWPLPPTNGPSRTKRV